MGGRFRLAEMVAVLAMATDLGLGLPMEHAVRACLLSTEIGRRAGLGRGELSDLYYLTLLRMLGCTADSGYYAGLFGDEVAFARDTQHLDYGDMDGFGRWVMESFAAGRPADERQRMIEKLFTYTPDQRRAGLAGHCEVAQMLASRLGLAGAVTDSLGFVFERWDGTGEPGGAAGEALPFVVRVMSLANELEVHHRLGGPDAAVAMATKRSGSAFDPAVVEVFCADPGGILAVIGRPSLWEDLLAGEPEPHRVIGEEGLIEAGRVMGDFADQKSAFFAGHTAQVAGLAVSAARRLGLTPARQRTLRFAALARDLGRAAISTAIWDKPSRLTDAEWESVRLHSYYTERMLLKVPALAEAAQLAGAHHERCDGSGYHRGSRAQSVLSCVLAAADIYVAMRHARAWRPALDPGQAGAELRALAGEGKLEPAAVNAVLGAAGDTGPQVRRQWPAGLTGREVDVLRRIAAGDSIQQAAAALFVAPKTVDFHLQNIYAKTGVTTRAGATLFAVQNDLLPA
jgi:HD-GYP domain-containing protein (c-di-GMP phosphodiesterase class II)